MSTARKSDASLSEEQLGADPQTNGSAKTDIQLISPERSNLLVWIIVAVLLIGGALAAESLFLSGPR